jgi:hypothetical protein
MAKEMNPMGRLLPYVGGAIEKANNAFAYEWRNTEDLKEAAEEHRLSLRNAYSIVAAVAATELYVSDPHRQASYRDAKNEKRNMLRDAKRPAIRPSRSLDPARGTLSTSILSMVIDANTTAAIDRLLSQTWVGFFRAERKTFYDPDALLIVRRAVRYAYASPFPTNRQVGDRIRRRTRRIMHTDPDPSEASFHRTKSIEKLSDKVFANWCGVLKANKAKIDARLARLISWKPTY